MNHKYDTIVLGLGAVGAATTYQLSRRGSSVLGIDQFSPPHNQGSSHGNSRITRSAIGEGASNTPYNDLVKRSNEIWREIEYETGKPLLSQVGLLIISSNEDVPHNHVENFFDNTVQAAKKYDIAHEILDPNLIRERFPVFKIKDNEFGYYESNAGYLNADECVSTQIELSKKHKADILVNEEVIDIESIGDEVRVTTTTGVYFAGNIVICAGSWITKLLDSKFKKYFEVTRQVLYWFDIEQNYDMFAPDKFPTWIWEPMSSDKPLYGFPAIDGPEGGFKLSAEQVDIETSVDDIDRVVTEMETQEMFNKYVSPFFSGVSNHCVKAITCLYTSTRDAQFVVDYVDSDEKLIFASACSGHGFKHSAGIGDALAEIAMTGSSTIDLSAFRLKK